MSALREAAQKVLETLYQAREFTELYDNEHAAEVNEQCHDAITVLLTALKQEEEASAWLAERMEHWRKEREKAQATKDQDPELSAALGWPGGISDPVLNRKVLLQMVAALRLASQQALEALGLAKLNGKAGLYSTEIEEISDAITALRAALAQPVPHGCHVYLRPGMKPDGCVLDDGRPENCIYAKRLLREGKDKTACEYWQPIEVTR